MSEVNDLTSLRAGESACVDSVGGTEPVMMRLLEMGLIPGRSVTVVRQAAFGGPIELLVDQTRIAVRVAEASRVSVVNRVAGPDPVRADSIPAPQPVAV